MKQDVATRKYEETTMTAVHDAKATYSSMLCILYGLPSIAWPTKVCYLLLIRILLRIRLVVSFHDPDSRYLVPLLPLHFQQTQATLAAKALR